MKMKGQYESVVKGASIQNSTVLIRKHDIEGALAVLIDANNSISDDADIIYLILDIYAKTENFEKVIEFSDKLMKMNAGVFYDCTAKYFHAHALDKLGRDNEAKDEYRKLTTSLRKVTIETPSFYEGYIYRLLSHTRIGEFDKALELADYLENLYPEKTDSNAFRYFIYNEMGDTGKAEEQKKLALEKNPSIKL